MIFSEIINIFIVNIEFLTDLPLPLLFFFDFFKGFIIQLFYFSIFFSPLYEAVRLSYNFNFILYNLQVFFLLLNLKHETTLFIFFFCFVVW